MKARVRLRDGVTSSISHPRRHACQIPRSAAPALRCSVSVALTVPKVAGHFQNLTEFKEGHGQAGWECHMQSKHCSSERTVDRELESELHRQQKRE